MGPLGLVELQRLGERIEHAAGSAGDLAALESGVVLHAEPGDGGDLAAPETWHATRAHRRKSGLVGGDPRATSGEELAHLLTVVHVLETRRHPAVGGATRGALSVHPPTGPHGRGIRRVDSMTWGRPAPSHEEESDQMRQVVMYEPGDVRVEEREDPRIIEPTDAIIRLSATCICGSDLWPYRGAEPVDHQVMGHEYVGVVAEVGSDVRTVKVGDFVVGSFWASDNTCEICQAGYQAYCVHRVLMGTIGTQSELARIPLADGTLVATPGMPDADLIPSLMAASDVLGTGWFAAVAAEAGPGKTVAVVGDGAVGLLGILAAKQLGAERIIAFSRHADRQALAREFGATDIVEERGEDGVAKIKALTGGLGAHSVIEAVGTQEAMMQAIHSTRPGGHVGFVGVSHDVAIPGDELFMAGVHIHGGPAPVREYLPHLVQLVWDRKIDPGKVFDLTLPLDQAADGYKAMDERTATKVLLTV